MIYFLNPKRLDPRRSTPIEIEGAARVDGATELSVFVLVVLPVVRNGVVTVYVFSFILTWGEFRYASTFLNDPGTYPVRAVISQQVTQFGVLWNRLMIIAVLSPVPVLALFVLIQRRLASGLSLGPVR